MSQLFQIYLERLRPRSREHKSSEFDPSLRHQHQCRGDMLISIGLYIFNVVCAARLALQNCPPQLAMQSCALFLYIRCGSSTN